MDKKTQKTMFSSASDEWATPQWLYDAINDMYGPFTLDPCATAETAKCSTFFTQADDGLARDWAGHTAFVNPPYSRGQQSLWVRKCYEEGCKPDTRTVMLIPARTDTKRWHAYVMKADEVRLIAGRITFVGADAGAPFPSATVHFNGGGTLPAFLPLHQPPKAARY